MAEAQAVADELDAAEVAEREAADAAGFRGKLLRVFLSCFSSISLSAERWKLLLLMSKW